MENIRNKIRSRSQSWKWGYQHPSGHWVVLQRPIPQWLGSRAWVPPHLPLLSFWTLWSRTSTSLERQKIKQNRKWSEKKSEKKKQCGDSSSIGGRTSSPTWFSCNWPEEEHFELLSFSEAQRTAAVCPCCDLTGAPPTAVSLSPEEQQEVSSSCGIPQQK